MRIVLLGSGSIFVSLSSSSPSLGIFEAIYGLWGNHLASIKVNWRIMALMRLFYDDLCKHYLIFSILCRPFRFGSSILSVWFRKHAARAASNSHVWGHWLTILLIIGDHHADDSDHSLDSVSLFLWYMGDLPCDDGWSSLGRWITVLKRVNNHHGDGGWPSWRYYVILQGMVGDPSDFVGVPTRERWETFLKPVGFYP